MQQLNPIIENNNETVLGSQGTIRTHSLDSPYRSIGFYLAEAIAVNESLIWDSKVQNIVSSRRESYSIAGSQTYSRLLEQQSSPRANGLLKFFGKWQGDDFEDCLAEVYNTRSVLEFD
jgi:hypothetical protein